MSGHSKWSKIKRQKGAADLKKGNLFTKLGQNITLAVKDGGGGDPDMNFLLRVAIEKAKESNVPKDTIERAIKRGMGEGETGALENITYDVSGKEGIAVLVDCSTDNKNRTLSDIRKVINKTDFSLSGGSLSWLFESKGRICLGNKVKAKSDKFSQKEEIMYKEVDLEELMLELMEIEGVEDLSKCKQLDEEGKEFEAIEILTKKNNFAKVSKEIELKELKVSSAGIIKCGKNKLKVDSSTVERIKELKENLGEIPEVEGIWSNVNL